MNRLSNATSPYLLQHKDNPVDWWQWGPDAFDEARRRNRPVLLSVGYAACHWCHVMAHESFENPATAGLMNELFVNIKVDREERPDVDQIYMSALHALGQQGGWPLTMFLTAEGEPVWGGTYFPPEPKFGRPSFTDILRAVSQTFSEQPDRVRNNRDALAAHLRNLGPPPTTAGLSRADIDDAAARIRRIMDPVNGGISGAPKFPNVPVLELLWRAWRRTGEPAYRECVLAALRGMARGGIRDHVGGGFARYSVDAEWLAPHFEKMLYDNAQLLEIYALAAAETAEPLFTSAATGIVDWLQREMVEPDGSFAASLDADSEGHEGRFYVWRREDLDELLGADDAALFAAAYDIKPGGNWEGVSIPNLLRQRGDTPVATERLAEIRCRLLAERGARPRPAKDDKILADWNGLMITALARAGALLGRADWVAMAARAFDFVAANMRREGRLGHSYRAGHLVFPGFASDYGAMARAALTLFEALPDPSYLRLAGEWLGIADADYRAEDGAGYATTSRETSDLPVRPRPTLDDAMPNPNALLIEAQLALATALGDDAARDRADATLESLAGAIAANVIGHASLLNVLDRRLRGAEVLVVGADPMAEELSRSALALPYPERFVVQARSLDALPPGHPARNASLHDTSAAFICAGDRCSLPVTDPKRLAEMFRGDRDVSLTEMLWTVAQSAERAGKRPNRRKGSWEPR